MKKHEKVLPLVTLENETREKLRLDVKVVEYRIELFRPMVVEYL